MGYEQEDDVKQGEIDEFVDNENEVTRCTIIDVVANDLEVTDLNNYDVICETGVVTKIRCSDILCDETNRGFTNSGISFFRNIIKKYQMTFQRLTKSKKGKKQNLFKTY